MKKSGWQQPFQPFQIKPLFKRRLKDLWPFGLAMAIKKFSSQSMAFSRVLSQVADDIRRTARQAVDSARSEKRKSRQIIEQSHHAIENAQKVMKESRQQWGWREKKRSDGRPGKNA